MNSVFQMTYLTLRRLFKIYLWILDDNDKQVLYGCEEIAFHIYYTTALWGKVAI